MLQGQLQSYAASVEDDDIREATARGFGRLVDYVETVSGADRVTVAQFFAKGMLMNVLAAMQYSISSEPKDSWAARLAEGCREDESMKALLFFLQMLSNQSLDRNLNATRR